MATLVLFALLALSAIAAHFGVRSTDAVANRLVLFLRGRLQVLPPGSDFPGGVFREGIVPRIAIDVNPALYGRSGPGIYLREVLKQIASFDNSKEYVLVSSSWANAAPDWIRLLTAKHANFVSFHFRLPGRALSAASLLSEFGDLSELIGRVDLFHARNYFYVRPRGASAVSSVFDLGFFRNSQFTGQFDPHLLSARYRAAKSDCILTVSNDSKDDVHKMLGVPMSRIRVAYGAADPELFRPRSSAEIEEFLRRSGLRPGGYVLFVGKDRPRKNLARVFAAMERAFAEGIPTKLVLVGITPAEMKSRYPMVISPSIISLGEQPDEDLARLYSGARALLFPSLHEGFGLPVIEAMASGTPVVTSSRIGVWGGALEEVSGGAAHLINPNSTGEIVEAIRTVVTDDDFARGLSAKGLQRARAFSWKRTAEGVSEAYDAILDGERPD